MNGKINFKVLHEKYRHKPGLLRLVVKLLLLALVFSVILSSVSYIVFIPRYTQKADGAQAGIYKHYDNIDSLSFNDKDASFEIKMKSGNTWYTNPSAEAAENDDIARGINRMIMQSQLVIKVADSDNRLSDATSFVNALDRGNVMPEIEKVDNRYVVNYKFILGNRSEGQYIMIPLVYEICNGALNVSVDLMNIDEDGEYKLVSISLLPFFGAGSSEDTGYILVPDGSGALIDFNSLNTLSDEYSAHIYGRDNTLKTQRKTQVREGVRIPAFGLKNGDNAFLVIIDEGEGQASITAKANGIDSTWNTAYFTFYYREFDTITLNDMSWDARRIPLVGDVHSSEERFSIKYYFLEGEEANYAGMAKVNRNYILEKYNLEPLMPSDDVPLYIDLNMSVRRIKPFLGLPTTAVDPLTTFEELSEMIDNFRNAGIDSFVIKMNGWFDGGPYGTVPQKAKVESAIGGIKGFMETITQAQENEDTLIFPAVDFTEAYKNGKGFLNLLQGARDISGAMALQHKFLQSTGVRDLNTRPWYLLNPEYSVARLQRFYKSYAKLIQENESMGLAVDGYGSILYSDTYESILDSFTGRTAVDRGETLKLWQGGLELVDSPVMVSGGNAYTLKSADYIVNIPMDNSRHSLFTQKVPYYQMVLSGLVHTASTPVNFSEDKESFLLFCLETGTNPLYSFITRESSLVKDTKLDYIYNGQYTLWFDETVEAYKHYDEAFKKISGRNIINHETVKDKVTVTYDGGIIVEIDYESNTFTITGGEEL